MKQGTGNKASILAACKYYKGEKKNPWEAKKLLDGNGEYRNRQDRDHASLWFYESKFAEMMQTVDGRRMLNDNLAEYRAYKGKSLSNVHELLLALLFDRYFHWSSSSPSEKTAMEGFYNFIRKFYP